MKKPSGTIISKSQAMKIAMDWHSGQWSPFYSFGSSGIYDDGRYQDYVRECDVELSAVVNHSQRRELENLKRWFDYKHFETSEGMSGMRLELLGGMGRELPTYLTVDRTFLSNYSSPLIRPVLEPVIESPTVSPYTIDPLKLNSVLTPSTPIMTTTLPTTVTPLVVEPIAVAPQIKPVLIPSTEPEKPVTTIEKITNFVNQAKDVVTQVKQNLSTQSTSTPLSTDNKKEAGVSLSTGVMIASLGGAAILTGLMLSKKKKKRAGMGRLKKSRRRKRSRR